MSELNVAIYEPARPGWPYIVMLKIDDEYRTLVACTRTEARQAALNFRLSNCRPEPVNGYVEQPAAISAFTRVFDGHGAVSGDPASTGSAPSQAG